MTHERIAVIGSGVAGIAAAYLLSKKYRVALYEATDRIGGHTHTIQCDNGLGGTVGIDVGSVGHNDTTFPTFHRFLKELDVPWRYADLSVAVHDVRSGVQFSNRTFRAFFARHGNLWNVGFLKMLPEIARFWSVAQRDLREGISDEETLGAWLVRRKFSGPFVDWYLLPMATVIWSSAIHDMLQFPVGTFLEFYRNHGLLRWYPRPRWKTVTGGATQYLEAFRNRFSGEILLNHKVVGLDRNPGGVRLFGASGQLLGEADRVVIATHADQVLGILGQAARPEERSIFSAWKYQRTVAVLHQDSSVMPPLRDAWASRNCRCEDSDQGDGAQRITVSYHMNPLQGLPESAPPYFVTLNPHDGAVYRGELSRVVCEYPIYTREAVRTRAQLHGIQGCDRTYYCGSYFGYGLHEDAVKSAVNVAALCDSGFSLSP